jgi:hypothetical protein
MKDFVYNGQPSRVVFGAGSLVHLEHEIERLWGRPALVRCTPAQQEQLVAERLGGRAAGVFAHAAMHVPIATAREARDEARRARTVLPPLGRLDHRPRQGHCAGIQPADPRNPHDLRG